MIDAGLYGIDVSNWKDEDFDCLNPAKSGSLVAQSSIATVVNPSTLTVVEPSSSPIVEPSTSALVEPSTSALVEDSTRPVDGPFSHPLDVDVASWKDEDFKIPPLPFRERKDLNGKIKKSSNIKASKVVKAHVTEAPKACPSTVLEPSLSQVDVSGWKDDDFTQK